MKSFLRIDSNCQKNQKVSLKTNLSDCIIKLVFSNKLQLIANCSDKNNYLFKYHHFICPSFFLNFPSVFSSFSSLLSFTLHTAATQANMMMEMAIVILAAVVPVVGIMDIVHLAMEERF